MQNNDDSNLNVRNIN